MERKQLLAFVESLERHQRDSLLQWLKDNGDYRGRREALQEILAAPQVFHNAEEVIEYLVANDCPTQAEAHLLAGTQCNSHLMT